MTDQLILLFNHQLTDDQLQDAERTLSIRSVVAPPPALQALWSQVPADLPEIEPFLDPIKDWLRRTAHAEDHVLIQGDFGATCLMVRFALELDLVPVYATTERQATEELLPDGSLRLVHRFVHRRFRQYGV